MIKWFIAAALLAIAIAFAFGVRAGLGMTLGICGSVFNLWAMWLMTRSLGKVMAANTEDELLELKKARIGSVLVVLAFFSKLPIFLGLAALSRHIGPPALTCFLVGLGLVYSALTGWAVANSYSPP